MPTHYNGVPGGYPGRKRIYPLGARINNVPRKLFSMIYVTQSHFLFSINPLHKKMNTSSMNTFDDLLRENFELRQENKRLKKRLQELLLGKQCSFKKTSTPMYKPRHTDYNNTSSPEMEELHDTIQIMRDSAYARQLSCIPEPLTITEQLKRTKQIIQDSILARKLSRHDL